LPACLADLTALREKRRELEEKLARISGPHTMYRAGKDNPAAAGVLRPLLEPELQDEHGQVVPFDLVCHDLACRIESLWPVNQAHTFRAGRGATHDLALRTGNWEMNAIQPVRDSLTHEPVEKLIAYVGLRRQDGGPATEAILERSPDWIPVRSAVAPPTDRAHCRQEMRDLEQALVLERLLMEAGRDPSLPDGESTPNLALAARLTPVMRDLLAQAFGPTTVEVKCHDLDCRVEVPAALAKRDPRWLNALRTDAALESELATSTYTVGEPIAYLRMLPRGFRSGRDWLMHLLEPRLGFATRDAAIAGCRPGRGVRGTVGIQMSVTTGLLPDDAGNAEPIHYEETGSLAGTSAADCVMAVYRQLIGEVEVPATLWEGTVTFEHEWRD
jgi:hypothetical protein